MWKFQRLEGLVATHERRGTMLVLVEDVHGGFWEIRGDGKVWWFAALSWRWPSGVFRSGRFFTDPGSARQHLAETFEVCEGIRCPDCGLRLSGHPERHLSCPLPVSFGVDRLVDSFGEKWEIRSASGRRFRSWWIADPRDDGRKSSMFPDLRATELALTQRIENADCTEEPRFTASLRRMAGF